MKLTIEYRWMNGTSLFILSFLFLWLLVGVTVGMFAYMRNDTLVSLASLGAIVIGLYLISALFFNITFIQVTPEVLDISNGPIPWIGDKIIQLSDIQSFYFVKHYTGDGRLIKIGCILTNGKTRDIFPSSSITKPDDALIYLTKIVTWLEPYRKIEIKIND